MNPMFEVIISKVINEAISAAKNPEIQEHAEEYVAKLLTCIKPLINGELKNVTQLIPLALAFAFGASLGGLITIVAVLLRLGVI